MTDEHRWSEPITPERQAELQSRLDTWNVPNADHRNRLGPFDHVKLTGADVRWLVEQSGYDTRAQLPNLHLEHADLIDAHLERAYLRGAHLEGADLIAAHLERADLNEAHLERADLRGAHLERARLYQAHLEDAYLEFAHLEDAFLREVHLEGADLHAAFLSEVTSLEGSILGDAKHGYVRVADVHWGGVNLAVVELPPARLLGDERVARMPKEPIFGKPKVRDKRLREFQTAVRANRQLAVALEVQGLNEEAGRFACNAQLLQQQVFWRQRRFGRWFFSRLLDAVAGYGYKPVRGLLAYVAVIIGFLLAYMFFGVVDASCAITGMSTTGSLLATCSPAHTLTFQEALVFSLTSFHGRGFFPGGLGLGSPITLLAAIEAVIGLIIEISFIATFTQRFFGAK
jgi:uncharacterized protein YjbI with pentapeptide repeats